MLTRDMVSMLTYNKRLRNISRVFRSNMKDAERSLWARIRNKRLGDRQFYRQKTIGDYIVDFYCPKAKLVIEVDGSQHVWPAGRETDRRRDAFMYDQDLTVLRFSDVDVLTNLDGVVSVILDTMVGRQTEIPLSPPLPKGGEYVQPFNKSSTAHFGRGTGESTE